MRYQTNQQSMREESSGYKWGENWVCLQLERSCCKSVEVSLFPSQLLTVQNVLHPSSQSGKVLFSPERLTPLQPLCVCFSEGCTCFHPRQLWPSVTRFSARSAPLFGINQGDSHPRNWVKSTFVGQVGSPLRTQPDAQTSPKAARKVSVRTR